MILNIFSADKIDKHEVESVYVKQKSGDFQILPNHQDFVANLNDAKIILKDEDFSNVKSGVLTFRNGECKILVSF